MQENGELVEFMRHALVYLIGQRLITNEQTAAIDIFQDPTGHRTYASCDVYEVHAFDFNRVNQENVGALTIIYKKNNYLKISPVSSAQNKRSRCDIGISCLVQNCLIFSSISRYFFGVSDFGSSSIIL